MQAEFIGNVIIKFDKAQHYHFCKRQTHYFLSKEFYVMHTLLVLQISILKKNSEEIFLVSRILLNIYNFLIGIMQIPNALYAIV